MAVLRDGEPRHRRDGLLDDAAGASGVGRPVQRLEAAERHSVVAADASAATVRSQRRLAVLGSPIEHSLSPLLHNAAYTTLGLPWQYDRAEVGSGELLPFLQGLGDDWLGLSLTMPLKREVIAYLDEVTPLVNELQVANTLRFASGRSSGTRVLQGANTDVWGIEQALREAGIERLESAEVIGSGATALSSLRALADLGARSVRLHARTPEHAGELVDRAADWGVTVDVVTLTGGELALTAPAVVSTLPAHAADAIEPRLGSTGDVLLDVAYDPWPSTLATRWQAIGGTAVSGIEMLLWQAVAQVRFFVFGDDTRELPDEPTIVRAMRAVLPPNGMPPGDLPRP
ncbi:shikimate dehydrogenase [Pseudoclavibacter sp. CFCC 14310]|nr:shikimate dehydrogenase [Pseudoclavibacter sp. CFCC 14310]KAB1663417.1 shikimate dehydrogenase [Pseudoclavibacter sp. CFCC 13611]